ncbi:unnamed protein product [Clonostachys rosea]|uniref:Uncharacterized protein n=1 Tax=Bionectria ochroleuca TaxID=29856 RepID=A0ABY6V442_BIOOC|nr:unnamed protein product [Clonostachys rosea]
MVALRQLSLAAVLWLGLASRALASIAEDADAIELPARDVEEYDINDLVSRDAEPDLEELFTLVVLLQSPLCLIFLGHDLVRDLIRNLQELGVAMSAAPLMTLRVSTLVSPLQSLLDLDLDHDLVRDLIQNPQELGVAMSAAPLTTRRVSTLVSPLRSPLQSLLFLDHDLVLVRDLIRNLQGLAVVVSAAPLMTLRVSTLAPPLTLLRLLPRLLLLNLSLFLPPLLPPLHHRRHDLRLLLLPPIDGPRDVALFTTTKRSRLAGK